MHEHDQELIMALAEGTLTPDAAAAASADIATCAECTSDLELQRIALDALEEAPAVYMSAAESARLHKTLQRELGLPAPAPARAQSQPVWGRVAGWAFGAAAVFLGAVLLLPALAGGGDDEAADLVAIESTETTSPAAATSSAAFQVAPMTQDAASEAGAGELRGADDTADAEDGGLPEAATETTAAPSMATSTTTSDDNVLLLEVVEEGDLTEETRTEVVATLLVDVDTYRPIDEAVKTANPSIDRCLEDTTSPGYSPLLSVPAGSDPQLVGLIAGEDGEERLLVAYVPSNVRNTALAAISVDGCRVYQAVP